MPKQLKIILLSPYLPSINTTACARKIYDSIRLLHERGHLVYLLSFCSSQDREKINVIRPYCAQLHLEYIRDYSRFPFTCSRLKQKIDSLSKDLDIDILQCEKAYMSRYIPKNLKVASVLIEHEILSVSFAEKSRLENNFIQQLILFARKTKKRFEEERWFKKFNKIIVFSENDKEAICKLYNIEHIEVIPLGIVLKDYPLQSQKEKPYDIIFVGNFSHFPNVDAVLYFYKEIWPLIKKNLPHISVMIVGANPPLAIKKLAGFDKNITVSGYVQDILEYYSKSKVFIAPIRYGTGMRYKILEAMAAGVPVVSTSVGVQGIFAENIRIADTPSGFVEAVTELLNDAATRKDLTENARLAVEKRYNWDMLLDRYENIYYSLLNRFLKNEQSLNSYCYI